MANYDFLVTLNQNIILSSLSSIIQAEMGLFSAFSAIDTNYVKKKFNQRNVLYLLDTENVGFDHLFYDFIIYRGAYWDNLAWNADLILPFLTLLELPYFYTVSIFGKFVSYKQAISLQVKIPTISFLNENTLVQSAKTIYDYFSAVNYSLFYNSFKNSLKISNHGTMLVNNNVFYAEFVVDYFFDSSLIRVNPVFLLKTKNNIISINNFTYAS